MKLSERQIKFTKMIALLVQYADFIGYDLTYGDAYSKKEFGVHSPYSKHYRRLAVDFNLRINGVYQKTTEAHRPLGTFWEMLGGTWGGNFPNGKNDDGNHYEYRI